MIKRPIWLFLAFAFCSISFSGYSKADIRAEGHVSIWWVFGEVENGLGNNLDIGGDQSPSSFKSNELGEYYYSLRTEVSPLKYIKIGGHYSRNHHDNMLYNDSATVYDLDRTSRSADMQLFLPYNLLAVGMYGEGLVDDGWFRDGNNDYEYAGLEFKALKGFFQNKLQLGVRFDSYRHEFRESGDINYLDQWSYGINYNPLHEVRFQLNYITKHTRSDILEDIDDNIIVLHVQFFMNAGLATE